MIIVVDHCVKSQCQPDDDYVQFKHVATLKHTLTVYTSALLMILQGSVACRWKELSIFVYDISVLRMSCIVICS
jgi:hypothetical protein